MKKANNFKDFFPVDNSMSTNTYYDLVSEKFMNGIESHQRNRYNNSASVSGVFVLISAIFQIIIGLVVIVFGILNQIFKSLR